MTGRGEDHVAARGGRGRRHGHAVQRDEVIARRARVGARSGENHPVAGNGRASANADIRIVRTIADHEARKDQRRAGVRIKLQGEGIRTDQRHGAAGGTALCVEGHVGRSKHHGLAGIELRASPGDHRVGVSASEAKCGACQRDGAISDPSGLQRRVRNAIDCGMRRRQQSAGIDRGASAEHHPSAV